MASPELLIKKAEEQHPQNAIPEEIESIFAHTEEGS